MIHFFAIALCIAGFTAFATAMDRHQRDLLGRKLTPRGTAVARIVGGALLAMALAADMIGLGAAYGAVVWFGHLSLGAAAVLGWITYGAPGRKSTNNAGASK